MELNIAGEKMVFLFDGENAYDPLFPNESIINVKAKCGHITELIEKLQHQKNLYGDLHIYFNEFKEIKELETMYPSNSQGKETKDHPPFALQLI